MAKEKQQNLSNAKLKLALWYATNKILLKKILIFLLIGLNVILHGYSAYMAINFLIIRNSEYALMIQELTAGNYIDYQFLREAQKPADLVFSDIAVLSSANNRNDLAVKVYNPNANFIAEKLDYQFIINNEVAREETTYVYPEEEKYLLSFGVEGSDVEFRVVNIAWRRNSEAKKILKERFNFIFKNVKYQSADFSSGDSFIQSYVDFEVTNNSIYDFWEVGFAAVLTDQGRISAVNYMATGNFKSLETRNIRMVWPRSILGAGSIQIIPEVDVFDENSFMVKN